MECAAAQLCREAGARVSTNVHVRDLDFADLNVVDGRRLEVVADGLSLWHGAQLAINTTLVSLCTATEALGGGLQTMTALEKGGRARLVVLAAEVGGRWSKETATFLIALAKARAESSPFILQGRVKGALIHRWSAMLVCSAARAFAVSLLDRRPVPGTGGVIPSARGLAGCTFWLVCL